MDNLTKIIEDRLDRAEFFAEQGNIDSTNDFLYEALRVADEMSLDIAEKFNELRFRCYQNALLPLLTISKIAFDRGNYDIAVTNYVDSKRLMQDIGLQLSDDFFIYKFISTSYLTYPKTYEKRKELNFYMSIDNFERCAQLKCEINQYKEEKL